MNNSKNKNMHRESCCWIDDIHAEKYVNLVIYMYEVLIL